MVVKKLKHVITEYNIATDRLNCDVVTGRDTCKCIIRIYCCEMYHAVDDGGNEKKRKKSNYSATSRFRCLVKI